MSQFEDIRPFNDSEVRPALDRLLADAEFIAAITAFRFAGYPGWLRSLIRPLVKRALGNELKPVHSVASLQDVIEKYVTQVIEGTTTGLSFSGLDQIDHNEPHLFISNHRDIVMDPAFVNYALYHHKYDTVRIAIGDNLLQKPYVSDLMRLNKSFIVKRSATGVREKMQAYMGLSSYIEHSIKEGCPIWIAQREGRAKDGIDETDPTIIKMLFMSQKKTGVSFSDYIRSLNIVPVSLSYEYNPCDRLIARELHQKRETGSYQKAPGEDDQSIRTGITGNKGHVHVAFGQQLTGAYENPDSVAAEIDEQVTRNYRLHPSAHIAARMLGEDAEDVSEDKQQEFNARLEGCSEGERRIMLEMYANPLLRRKKLAPECD